MKKNICIIGLAGNYINLISKQFSDSLNMFYANIEELLQYDLLDLNEAEKINGVDYVLKKESGKIKTVVTYEKVVINLSYGALTRSENYKAIEKRCTIIYLRVKKTELEKFLQLSNLTDAEIELEKKLFNDRDKFCKGLARDVVEITFAKKDNAVSVLKNSLEQLKKR